MSQKGFSLVLILIGMLLVAGVLIGGGYYIGTLKNKSQTQNPVVISQSTPSPASIPDPTADWKIYADQNQTKVPADSQTPTAGACAGPSNDEIVTVSFGMDNVAQPRCTKVTSNQKLKIVNNSNQTISGGIGSYTINIAPNKTQTIDATFGSYLLPGVHNIVVAEIWLQ